MSWLKRRHDVLNDTIQILKTELYLNDIVLTSEIGQRMSSAYDRTLIAAELYKERLEALTQSSRSQIRRVQLGQNPVAPTPVPLMSLDFGCNTWAPKRMKPNHAEGYTHDTITNSHQQLINNRNKKKKNKPKKTIVPAANGQAITKAIASIPKAIASVPNTIASVPNAIASVPNTIASVPKAVASVPNTIASVPKAVASVPNTIASVPKTAGFAANGVVAATNGTTSAVKAIAAMLPTAAPNTTALATPFTISALETITSAINKYAAKTTDSVTNTIGFAAKAIASTTKAATCSKATSVIKTTGTTKATGVTNATGVSKATGVTKATPAAIATGIKKAKTKRKASPFVAKAKDSAVKPPISAAVTTALKEQERKRNIVKNFVPKWVPIDKGQISGTVSVNQPGLVQVKTEPNDISLNTPSFFSVDMSNIKLQFAASDRITFKSENNPVEWAGNKNSGLVNDEDMMIDDLADHL